MISHREKEVPLFDYFGNFFNGATSNSYSSFGGEPVFSSNPFTNPSVSIMGKYMLTDQLAVKANLGILVENNKNSGYSTDDAAAMLNPLADAKVADMLRRCHKPVVLVVNKVDSFEKYMALSRVSVQTNTFAV